MTENSNTMRYLYQGEEIEPELWRWEAHYQDKSCLKQFDDAGNFHKFSEIDQTRLNVFKMVNSETQKSFVIIFNPLKMKLIHFYKNIGLELGGMNFRKVKAYVFGYEMNGEKHLLVVSEAHEIMLCNDSEQLDFI